MSKTESILKEDDNLAFDDGYDDEEDSSSEDSLDSDKRERADTFVGTVNYQSPEVIRGES